jgi:hypothetical protein
MEPNVLSDQVRRALFRLAPDDFASVRDQVLAGLEEAGVNIGAALFVLGILARTTAELTPSDLASLIRFVRLNSPQAMRAVASPLAQLVAAGDEMKSQSRPSRLAA